jgi:hypothetical protein
LGLRVLEKRVPAPVKAFLYVRQERRDPHRLIAIKPPRQLHKRGHFAPPSDRSDLNSHPGETY